MPRVKAGDIDYAMRDFIRNVRACGNLIGIVTIKDLAAKCQIPEDTMKKRIREPETIKFPEQLKMIRALKMGPEYLEPIMRCGKTR